MKRDGVRIGWLEEHMANDFPTAAEFTEAFRNTSSKLGFDFRLRRYKTNSLMLQRIYIPLLLNAKNDGLNLYLRALLKAALPLLARFNLGSCYRQLFIVEKVSQPA